MKILSDATINNLTGGLTGNSSTATKLANARNIALTGDVSGSASFDGSQNVSINAVVNTTGAMNILQYLSPAELVQVKGTTVPTLDMSVNVQAYVDASIVAGANKLYFPKGKYRFSNINLYDFSCAVEGEILATGNVTNTEFHLPSTLNALMFYGNQNTISFSGLAMVASGNRNDGLNTRFYKMNRLNGSSISVNNVYMTGFSGKAFELYGLIDSNFTNFNADNCHMPLFIDKGEWPASTTITLDKWYIRECNYGIMANYCGQSRMTDVIIEWCTTKAMEIQWGSWTVENLYLENNTYGVDATDTHLQILSWYGYQKYGGDAIHNTQPNLDWFNKGTSTYHSTGANITRLQVDYTAPSFVLDGGAQAVDTWWEVGEWIGGAGGSNIEIEFRGASNFWQNVGGDGIWNTVGKTVLRATIANNSVYDVPNINAFMYQEGHGAVTQIKLVANNPERTAFKVYVKTGQYSPRVFVDVKISLGYWLTYVNQGVSDPGVASRTVVDVVNSYQINMASTGYFRVKDTGTLDLKTTETLRGSTSFPAKYYGLPVVVNGTQYYFALVV